MGHLPDHMKLVEWRRGEGLAADDLNRNFATVHGWIETVAAMARAPDAAARAALAQFMRRLIALERREAASEREKNERQYAPLAAHGELIRQVDELRREVAALRKPD